MASPIRNLRSLLGNQRNLTLQPSAQRSALVQSLMDAAQRNQGRPSTSLVESLDIAASPIIAALVGRREDESQRQESERIAQRQQALARALQRANDPNLSSEQRQAAQIATRTIASGLPADNPVAQAAIARQISTPEPPDVDLKNIRVPGINQTFSATVGPDGVASSTRGIFQPGEFQVVSTSVQGAEREVFPSEGERRAGFASRNLLNLEAAAQKAFEDNPDFNPGNISEVRGNLPVIGNIVASPGFRQYKAAADEWTTNMVFLRSGATAREEEKTSAFRNLWPQPGDDQETIDFKERLRLIQEREAFIAGGRDNRIGQMGITEQEAQESIRRIDERLAALENVETELSGLSVDELSQMVDSPDADLDAVEAEIRNRLDAIEAEIRNRLRN